MKKIIFLFIFFLAASGCFLSGAYYAEAATLTVNSLLDDGDGVCDVTCTFRDALTTAIDGDTIEFSVAGVIVLSADADDYIYIENNINIVGPGQDVLTIDFNANINNLIQFNNTGEVNISGLTFINAPDAVFYINGLIGNETGVYNISDSTFTDNSVWASVYVENGDWNFNNVTFSNNSSNVGGGGGAIYYSGVGDLTITNSTFSNNTSDQNGGAIYYTGTENLTITNSSFTNNSTQVGNSGGAIFFENGQDLIITNSTFNNNSANNGGYGGALYVDGNSSQTTITNSTLADNSGTYGGAVYLYDTIANITNSIFYNNSADEGDTGSAIYNEFGDVNVVNSIIYGTNNCYDTTTSLGHNIDSGTTCGFSEETDMSETDPLLDPDGLQDNGGPVETIALLEGSPAIDAGDDEQSPETDARGFARVGTSDIGAFEYNGIDPDAEEEEEDLCPNIDGIQTSVPSGKRINGQGDCVNRTTSSGSSPSRTKTVVPPTLPPTDTPPTDCLPIYFFSPSTGKPCPTVTTPLTNTPPVTTLPTCTILITLKQGMTNPEVKCLQQYLNTNGSPVSLTGPGSLNNETNFFGSKTLAAVKAFQTSKGLIPDGVVGPKTRNVLGL